MRSNRLQISALMFALVLLAACALPPSAPQPPIHARLDVLSAGKLGESAQVQLTVTTDSDFAAGHLIFKLPAGVTLVSGELEHPVSFRAHEPQKSTITLRLDATGEKMITGGALVNAYGGSMGNWDVIYLEVSETGTRVQRNSQSLDNRTIHETVPGTPLPTPSGPRAPRIPGWLHTDGAQILDSENRAIRFLGIDDDSLGHGSGGNRVSNLDACGFGWQGPDSSLYTNLAEWGFNTVRLGWTWANLEPAPPTRNADGSLAHRWNQDYLAMLDMTISRLQAAHIAVILDMHRDACRRHSRTLTARTALCVRAPAFPRGCTRTRHAKSHTKPNAISLPIVPSLLAKVEK